MEWTRRSTLLGLLGLGAALATPAALARGRARFRSRGLPAGAVHRGPVLSRAQLSECVAQQKAIDNDGTEVDRLQAEINQSEVALNARELSINRREAMVDHYSQQSVDNFNRLIDQHRREVERHNAMLGRASERIDQVNAAVQRFNTQCADRAYYESDMRAVLAER